MNLTLSRRSFVALSSLGLYSALHQPESFGQAMNAKSFYVYIGTYTSGKSEGIYIYRFDTESGTMEPVSKAVDVVNPSFLAIDPKRETLFAVNEIGNFNGQNSGAVSSFKIDRNTGGLTFINQQATRGGAPCYVSVDNESKWILVANYSGGNLAVLPVESGGMLGEAAYVARHRGSSVNPNRQREPHAHCVMLSPDNRFAFAPDLGIDKVMMYELDHASGRLNPHSQQFAQTAAGAGPRHFAFHPSLKFAYVICELNSTITAFAYNENIGSLSALQTVSTLPDGFTGSSSCADIHVSPDGRFLYGSNRGHDSIAIFKINETDGKLEWVGSEPTQGKTPRNFNIDPTGAYLLAANQNSDSITIFKRNPDDGTLTSTGKVEVPTPVCIRFMAVEETSVQ